MKYQKKPVVRDVSGQFGGFYAAPYPKGVLIRDNTGDPDPEVPRHEFYVLCRGQRVNIRPGDWIVREPDGMGYYPVDNAIFLAEYEPLPDPCPADTTPASVE